MFDNSLVKGLKYSMGTIYLTFWGETALTKDLNSTNREIKMHHFTLSLY